MWKKDVCKVALNSGGLFIEATETEMEGHVSTLAVSGPFVCYVSPNNAPFNRYVGFKENAWTKFLSQTS